ncbi:histidine phosphatase family protein [Patescibacteria group bacterium]|nr:histidine phosphatase family protein [Patescibacteria group bacterium]MBU1931926.1 histidine phosphatase family protein [Patescibacteria group bacterium]
MSAEKISLTNLKSWVELKKRLDGLKSTEAKFIIIIRHGELNNPKKIVYNRDAVMKPEDIIHLSAEGKKQLVNLGQLITRLELDCQRIFSSPESRTQESAEILGAILNIKITITDDLDEIYAPGPYLEGLLLDQWQKSDGNCYDLQTWGKYKHESREDVLSRMKRAFKQTVQFLQPGESSILVSHGDPIAFLANWLVSGKIHDPTTLREAIYPSKGTGIIAAVDPEGSVIGLFPIGKRDKTKIY